MGSKHKYLIDKISIIQNNAVHIITFAEFNAHADPIFKKLKILKIKDHITLQNCLLVYMITSITNCLNPLIILL